MRLMPNACNGSLPPLAIKADTIDLDRCLKKAVESAKRFGEIAKKVRQQRKPVSRPDDLEAFLRDWKEQNRQQQAWEYPSEVEKQISERMPNKGTLFGYLVMQGDGSA